MDHPTSEQLRAYVTEELPQEDAVVCEVHLALCQECSQRVMALLSVQANFDQIWSTWTARTHAEEFQIARIRHGLQRSGAAADIEGRLAEWAAHLGESVGAALAVSLDVSKRAANIAQEGLEFLRGKSFPRFEPIPVPLSIAGPGEGPQWPAFETVKPPRTKVTFDPAQRRAVVQSDNSTIPRPMVALVAKDGSWAQAIPFRAVEGEPFVLAEFEEIPSGEFLLLIEKTPDNQA